MQYSFTYQRWVGDTYQRLVVDEVSSFYVLTNPSLICNGIYAYQRWVVGFARAQQPIRFTWVGKTLSDLRVYHPISDVFFYVNNPSLICKGERISEMGC